MIPRPFRKIREWYLGSPKVSFVVPTWNRVAWLPECLLTLQHQSIQDIEIVVVDDGSADGTDEFMKWICKQDKRICYFKQPCNMGAGVARNKGIEIAKSKIIAVCDDDDMYSDKRADLIWRFYTEKNHSGVMVNMGCVQIDYNNVVTEEYKVQSFDKEKFKKEGKISYFSHPTAAYLKKDILVLGGYHKENEKMTDDFQLVVDWIRSGRDIAVVTDLVCYHRVLPDSIMARMHGWRR